MKEEKVPVEQVLDDMYGDKGPISWAARDYYYKEYATPQERESMDKEDKAETFFAFSFLIVLVALIVVSIIICVKGG